jgi:hypothetical protein
VTETFLDKKVEDFTQEEYEEFWNQYVEEQVQCYCEICHQPIRRSGILDHMEKNHDKKYQQHNARVVE